MKIKIIVIFLVFLIISSSILISSVSACTGFMATDGENILIGSNEDWCTADYNIRFFPAEDGKFGKVLFDFDWPFPWNKDYDSPYSGLNDQGLYYDSFQAPYLKIKNNGRKLPIFLDDYYSVDIRSHCLSVCTTVQEVIDIYSKYYLRITGLETGQHFWIDRNGDSVIIEGDDIIYRQGDFQVVTNFLHSHPELPVDPTAFLRYEKAVSMLENMTCLSVDYFKEILNETHLEKMDYVTMESHIVDLNKGLIYLYNFHNYDDVIVFNLSEELKKGKHSWINVPTKYEPLGNKAPITPDPPIGNTDGIVMKEYTFGINETTDPDNDEDQIYYKLDWGDGTQSNWYNKFCYELDLMKHRWKRPGTYNIKAKAKDIYGNESDWSEPFKITIQRSKLTKLLLLGAIGFIGIFLLLRLLNQMQE
ncbi:hypothetical protein AYK25_02345 [Thermoplasmatales archaeon SM1-50]|nr:MAG: hypothetical protein AYK25_02345 [Thermoplasmatales archaeon SM1-50]